MIRLKELRNSKNNPKGRKISQQEIADIIGAKRSTVSMWEIGASDPGTESVQKLADYFDVSVDYLLGRDAEESYYSDPEIDDMVNAVHKDPELKVLFNATKDLKKEDLEFVINLVKKMK